MFKTAIRAGAIVMVFLCHPVANAARVDFGKISDGSSNTFSITYTQGDINFGPLSFGLSTLPSEVNAQFILGPGTTVTGAPGMLHYGVADIKSAGVSFGDAIWTVLTSFELEVENGNVESLSYLFSPINSATATQGIALNFPLTITGTDTANNTEFSYTYSASTQSITVPTPATLSLFGLGLAGLGWSRRKKV
jgi:hypothetical protein